VNESLQPPARGGVSSLADPSSFCFHLSPRCESTKVAAASYETKQSPVRKDGPQLRGGGATRGVGEWRDELACGEGVEGAEAGGEFASGQPALAEERAELCCLFIFLEFGCLMR
jgi:hypothetical protein